MAIDRNSHGGWTQPAFGLLCGSAIVLALFGCGGGSSSSGVPAAGSAVVGSGSGITTLSLTVPNAASGSSAGRSAQAVPSAINGVLVYAYPAGGSQPSLPALVGDLALSPSGGNTSLCVAVSGARSCTLSFSAPVGSDVVSIQLYDAEPSGGSIPGTANLVASGMTTLTVGLNGSNVASITLNSVAGTVNGDGSATFTPLTTAGSTSGITGGSVSFAIPAGGVPSGEQVAVSEVLQLTLPLSSARSPQKIAPTPSPSFVPGGNTFIYGIGFTVSGGSLPLTQALTVSATFQVTSALATTLGAVGTFSIAKQGATSYTNVGSAGYSVTGTTLTITGTTTGILQPGIYVLYIPAFVPTPSPAPTTTPPP